MNSPAHDIALFLAQEGVGTFGGTTGWGIFVGSEPVAPVQAVTIYDTGGGEPDTDELDMFRPTFQVRVRAASYAIAYSHQRLIRDLLILTQPISFVGGEFMGVMMSGDILHIGRDTEGNDLLTANYRAIREEY